MSPSLITPAQVPFKPATATTDQPSTPTSIHSSGSRTFGRPQIHNTSMIESKFLSHPEELGVVAVGFSGGQVRPPPPLHALPPNPN